MKEFRGADREFIRFIFSEDREKMSESGLQLLRQLPVAAGGNDGQGERMAV